MDGSGMLESPFVELGSDFTSLALDGDEDGCSDGWMAAMACGGAPAADDGGDKGGEGQKGIPLSRVWEVIRRRSWDPSSSEEGEDGNASLNE